MTSSSKTILLTYIVCISCTVRIMAISFMKEARLKNLTSKCFSDIALLEPESPTLPNCFLFLLFLFPLCFCLVIRHTESFIT